MRPDEFQQVEHIARLAVLAMCARGVAQSEHEIQDEISKVVITVTECGAAVPAVDLEFFGKQGFSLGGLGL